MSEAWRASASARLEAAGRARALPFLAAAAQQVAGHTREGADAAGERALSVLLTPDPGAAARVLIAEPVLFAAFFQNLDLLYDAADPGADATSAIVLAALELAGHAGG